MPTFVADVEPIVTCGFDPETGFTLADLVYAVDVPAGSCADRGRSCVYRNAEANTHNAGIRYFRVQYATRSSGNRVWLESYGDLSAATQAKMMLVITINGRGRATLADTFAPLNDGGWFSDF